MSLSGRRFDSIPFSRATVCVNVCRTWPTARFASASTTILERTWTSPDASTTRRTGRRSSNSAATGSTRYTRRGDPRSHRRGIEASSAGRPSDSVVFTFAGHGSWLPDRDRDEPDARDEMMCPADVMRSSICSTTICTRFLHQTRGRQALRDRGLLSFGFRRAVRRRAG